MRAHASSSCDSSTLRRDRAHARVIRRRVTRENAREREEGRRRFARRGETSSAASTSDAGDDDKRRRREGEVWNDIDRNARAQMTAVTPVTMTTTEEEEGEGCEANVAATTTDANAANERGDARKATMNAKASNEANEEVTNANDESHAFDGDAHEEYEEYDEEVEYEFMDYVAEAKAKARALAPDFTWGATEKAIKTEMNSRRRSDFLNAKATSAHEVASACVTFVVFAFARATRLRRERARAEARAKEIMVTEDERIRQAKAKVERENAKALKEIERRRARDVEEEREREREREREMARAKEALEAKEEEARQREVNRAETRRRNAEEKERFEIRERQEAEAKAAERERERAERERERVERERVEAEERARRDAEGAKRGECELTVSADVEVVMKRDNAVAPVDVVVRARVGISAGASETSAFASADVARVSALGLCSIVAAEAVKAYGSDARLQDMIGVGPLSKLPGMDDLEFDNWTRVMQARMDSDLRTAIIRCGAALEVKLRDGKRTSGKETYKTTLRFRRRCLPADDKDNIAHRMKAAVKAAAEDIAANRTSAAETTAAADAVADIINGIERYELGQLHGLDPSIIFPAEHPKTGLSGELMASMLTLSHFVRRAERDYADDPRVAERAKQIAATLVGRSANKQGSWRAMYLDGFTGDALTSASSMADSVLPADDAIRMLLNAAVEDQLRRAAGEASAFEEEWPDADDVRKRRLKEIRDAQPITEWLWALRNSAAQLAQAGSKTQARTMLEEALEVRKRDVAKNGGDAENTAQALPELVALVKLYETVEQWSDECARARVDVLRSVGAAADEIRQRGDAAAAAALFESAMREYEPFLAAIREDKSFKKSLEQLRASVDERWRAADIDPSDVDAREASISRVVGGAGAIDAVTSIYTKELEVRRRRG